MEKRILENLLKSLELDLNKEIIFDIIPELKAEEGFEHKHPNHIYDVWEHTKVAIKKSKSDLQIRLTLLLHDIGKPHSYQEDGEVRHFKGHPQKSAEMAQVILNRLGYDESEIEDICYLVAHHNDIIDISKVDSSNIELTKKLLHIQYCDAYSHHPEHIQKRVQKLDEISEKLQRLEQEILKDKEDKGEK